MRVPCRPAMAVESTVESGACNVAVHSSTGDDEGLPATRTPDKRPRV